MIKTIREKINQWNAYKQKLKEKKYTIFVLVETIETIVFALVFALLIRKYMIQTSLVFSGSMEPTMMVGDRLFVNKVTYYFRSPHRGEIILFKSPYQDKKEFVKRLIGLPGEKVELINGTVLINDKLLTLPGINFRKDYDNFGPIIIPKNHYFALGDNRANSADSRVWGFVPKEDLIGKALYVFWPLNRMQILR